MADPYAERPRPLTGVAPPGDPPWLVAIAERGGSLLARCEDDLLAGSSFAAVLCRGAGLLPPLARLDPPQAAMLLAAHSEAPPGPAALSSALERLEGFEAPIYALKHGWVAGPEGMPGAVAIDAELISAVLDAAAGGRVEWERDPDFGYEVAASVPGLAGDRLLALCPRLLYAAHDRVYEHAELVALVKEERAERVRAVSEAPPAVAAATGWPIEPTGTRWKE